MVQSTLVKSHLFIIILILTQHYSQTFLFSYSNEVQYEPTSPAKEDEYIENEHESVCDICLRTQTPEILKQARILQIKEKIIQALGLGLPVKNLNYSRSVVIPEPLERSILGNYGNSKYMADPPTKKFILLSQRVETCRGAEDANCLFFDFKSNLNITGISHAILWVYIHHSEIVSHKPNHMLILSDADDPNRTKQKSNDGASRLTVPYGQDWYKFDVKDIVQSWLDQPHATHSFMISCVGCIHEHEIIVRRAGKFKPFIKLQEKPPSIRRRRSTTQACDQGHSRQCCREKLRIDLMEMNLPYLFIRPSNIQAYYCRGPCSAVQVQSTSLHATIRQVLVQNKKLDDEYLPCCAPTKFIPQTFLIAKEHGIIESKVVEDVIVEDCGCT